MKPLPFAVLVLFAFAPSWHASDGPRPKLPNIVFILADDLGWGDITPYGSTFHETPNLQKLADRSVRYTSFYTASPLCSPTRSSIMTGLYPARTGITAPVCHLPQLQLEKRLSPGNPNQQALNADSLTRLLTQYVTLADLLRALGYRTAHFGKWHLGHGKGYDPRDRGFDVDIPNTPKAAGPGGGYFAPWKFIADPKLKGEANEHIDEWMAGQAAKFITDNKDRPFFVNFWLYSVHGPWNGDKDLIAQFEMKADPKARQRNPLYAAMVKKMDNAVGTLLNALKTAGVDDNTIVIFTSDNGGWAILADATNPAGYTMIPITSNFPFRSGKASNYEGGTRVPCMIAWPGKARPGTSDALFSNVDFLPTLLEMTGGKLKNLPKHDGISQVPTLLGGKAPRDAVYVHFPHGSAAQNKRIDGFWPGTSVRKGDWKLIRFYAKNDDLTDRLELYNLKNDPGESKNLAAGNAARVKELAGNIDAFLKDTDAVIPKANPAFMKAGMDATAWTPSKDARLEVKEGVLLITSTGKDPFISIRDLPKGAGPYTVELKMKSNSNGAGQIFWSTNEETSYFRDRSTLFPVKHDSTWQNYQVKLPVEKALIGLRIDPSTAPGEILIESIRLKDRYGKELKAWTFAGKD